MSCKGVSRLLQSKILIASVHRIHDSSYGRVMKRDYPHPGVGGRQAVRLRPVRRHAVAAGRRASPAGDTLLAHMCQGCVGGVQGHTHCHCEVAVVSSPHTSLREDLWPAGSSISSPASEVPHWRSAQHHCPDSRWRPADDDVGNNQII